MKTSKTIRHDNYLKELYKLVKTNAEARKLEKRYSVMEFLLNKEYAQTLKLIPKSILHDFLKDIVYIDRKIRKATEGFDQEAKDIAEQEFILNEL